ncbi:class I SAM-dependent methyltransferase [Cupriavidus basilensis]
MTQWRTRSRYQQHQNLRFEAGGATAIPLPDASVDVVVSFETIEHLHGHDGNDRADSPGASAPTASW